MIYSVTPELYRETAALLIDAMGMSEYFSGSIVFTSGGMDCRLTTSVIVYRSKINAPDGVTYPITDLVPVWWEFHTIGTEGEIINDLCFTELKAYLIN